MPVVAEEDENGIACAKMLLALVLRRKTGLRPPLSFPFVREPSSAKLFAFACRSKVRFPSLEAGWLLAIES
jgi:hypothetical protein